MGCIPLLRSQFIFKIVSGVAASLNPELALFLLLCSNDSLGVLSSLKIPLGALLQPWGWGVGREMEPLCAALECFRDRPSLCKAFNQSCIY